MEADQILKLIAFGQLTLTAVVFAAGRRLLVLCNLASHETSQVLSRVGALFALAVSGFFICNDRFLTDLIGPASFIAVFFCVSISGWLWLFIRALFEDDIKVPMMVLVPVCLVFLAQYASVIRVHGFGLPYDSLGYGMDILHRLVTLGIAGHVLYGLVRGGRDDLIETRRQFRSRFALAVASFATAILTLEAIFDGFYQIRIVSMTLTAGIILLDWALIIFLVRGWPQEAKDPALVAGGTAATDDDLETDLVSDGSSATADPLGRALEQFITDGRFTEPGLTITALAQNLGYAEHRVRRHINQTLGYRNFSSFLNRHRIKAASLRLRAEPDVPVLTIAMDMGYGSLAPFNRAFKGETGVTPTDFRAQKH